MDPNCTQGPLDPIGRQYSTRSGSWNLISHSLVTSTTAHAHRVRASVQIDVLSDQNGACHAHQGSTTHNHIQEVHPDLIYTTTGAF